ncbi:hypothetical protein PGA39_002743, partial [Enterococcus faecalis]|nr:hypothetical protein [Enterococcus faecalis]
PEDILLLASKELPEGIGLLKISDKRKIQIIKPAARNIETSKLDILQAFIVKNI